MAPFFSYSQAWITSGSGSRHRYFTYFNNCPQHSFIWPGIPWRFSNSPWTKSDWNLSNPRRWNNTNQIFAWNPQVNPKPIQSATDFCRQISLTAYGTFVPVRWRFVRILFPFGQNFQHVCASFSRLSDFIQEWPGRSADSQCTVVLPSLSYQASKYCIGEFQNYLQEVGQNFISPQVNPQL